MAVEVKNKKNKNRLENLLALVLLFSLSVSFGFLFKLYFLTGEDASARMGTALRFDSPPVDTSSSRTNASREENLQPEKARQVQPDKGRAATRIAAKKKLVNTDKPNKPNEVTVEEGENLAGVGTGAGPDKGQGESSFSSDGKSQTKADSEKKNKKKPKTVYVFNSAALFPKKLGGVHAQWERVANIQKKKPRSFCREPKTGCLIT